MFEKNLGRALKVIFAHLPLVMRIKWCKAIKFYMNLDVSISFKTSETMIFGSVIPINSVVFLIGLISSS